MLMIDFVLGLKFFEPNNIIFGEWILNNNFHVIENTGYVLIFFILLLLLLMNTFLKFIDRILTAN